MNIKGIIKYAVSMLYRKRGFFFLEIFMMVLSVCLLSHAFVYYYVTNRGIIDLKNNIDVDIDELYKVYFGNLANPNNENGEAIYNFTHALTQLDGVDMAGKYYRETISVKAQGRNEAAGLGADTLFVDASLLDIHSLKNKDGKPLALYENTDDGKDYVSLAVGYNFRNSMPVGSKWTDTYYGRSYVVTDVLGEGETWMSTNIISEGEYELCLDTMFLTLSDDASFLTDGYMTCFVFANNVFFMAKSGEEIKERVRRLGQESGCPIVVQSVRELIENYRGNYREVHREVHFQVLMMTVMTVIGVFMTMLIALNIQKNNIRVMHIYGVSLKEHIIIHIINQGVTFVIAGVLSYLISHQRLRNLYMDHINYADKVMPYAFAFVLLLFAVTESVAAGQIQTFLNVRERNGE